MFTPPGKDMTRSSGADLSRDKNKSHRQVSIEVVSQDQSTAKFKKQKTFSSLESLGVDKELTSIRDTVK